MFLKTFRPGGVLALFAKAGDDAADAFCFELARDVSALPTGLGYILSSSNAGLKGPLFHGTSRPPSIEKSQHCRNAIFRHQNPESLRDERHPR